MDIQNIILILLSIIGTLVILLFNLIYQSINELKKEIKIIQHLENRITKLETIQKNGKI